MGVFLLIHLNALRNGAFSCGATARGSFVSVV